MKDLTEAGREAQQRQQLEEEEQREAEGRGETRTMRTGSVRSLCFHSDRALTSTHIGEESGG